MPSANRQADRPVRSATYRRATYEGSSVAVLYDFQGSMRQEVVERKHGKEVVWEGCGCAQRHLNVREKPNGGGIYMSPRVHFNGSEKRDDTVKIRPYLPLSHLCKSISMPVEG